MKKFLPTLVIACGLHIFATPVVQAAPLSEKVKIAKQQNEQQQKLNLNTATASELQSLPGIGASKAAAIIAYREQTGKFKTVDDLVGVKGIGNKMLAKIKDSVVVQ